MTVEQFEAAVAVQGDGELSVTTVTSGSVGTGSLVTVTDKVTNQVVEQFYVIIFGDVDGDAIARSADTGEVTDEIEASTWAANNQSFKIKAADLDGSGFLTGTDASRLKSAVRNTKEINQITGLAE
jgi:predicted secreted protein